MHRVMCDSPYQAAARLPDTESLPPGGIGGRLSKGHIDYDPFAATLDCLTQAMHDDRRDTRGTPGGITGDAVVRPETVRCNGVA